MSRAAKVYHCHTISGLDRLSIAGLREQSPTANPGSCHGAVAKAGRHRRRSPELLPRRQQRERRDCCFSRRTVSFVSSVTFCSKIGLAGRLRFEHCDAFMTRSKASSFWFVAFGESRGFCEGVTKASSYLHVGSFLLSRHQKWTIEAGSEEFATANLRHGAESQGKLRRCAQR